jgi:cytochrome P450 family 6/cytochrome P450 family 28
MQVKAAIIEIVRKFEISVNNKTQRPLVLDPKQVMNYKAGGLWLDFKPI